MLRNNKRRFLFSLAVLTLYGILMGIAGLNSYFAPPPLIMATICLTPIFAYLMGMIWHFDLVQRDRKQDDTSNQESVHSEKRKRQVLDEVLRDLSDEDLVRLKHRLQDGVIDDDVLYERFTGDDGEYMEKYN